MLVGELKTEIPLAFMPRKPLGMRASLRQCRALFEDDQGNDVVRRGVVCHIDKHAIAEEYKNRMEIAALQAKRQEQVDELYRLMLEVGLSPENHDMNESFVDKCGVERRPIDFLMISEDFLPPGSVCEPVEFPDIAEMYGVKKRRRGRPKRTEGVAPVSRAKRTPDFFSSKKS